MHTLQLYINDDLVDLSDDSPIALTFQINNLAEVKNQQGNTSNQFKLPLTQRNRAILGYPDEIPFCSTLPYSQYRARMVQDGIEVIPYGIAELNSIEQDTANITILSGNVDFFDAIDGKIYDLGNTSTGSKNPFKTYDHEWTLDNVVNSQAKTDGWIWPVVDYGKISTTTTDPINVRYLRPGFFLKTAIDLMVTNAGYKAKGSLLEDPLYNKLIVQFANDSFEHGSDQQNQPNLFSVSAQTTQIQQIDSNISDPSRSGKINFSKVIYGDTDTFNGRTFTAPIDMKVTVNLSYGVSVKGTRKGNNGINIFVRSNPNGQQADYAPNQHHSDKDYKELVSFKNQKLSADVDLKQGQQLIIAYQLESLQTLAYFNSDALLTITNNQKEVLYKQTVQCERIFPDISQKDLLKDTLQRFGIICQTDNTSKTVNFSSLKDIVHNIPKANDWTTKCLDQGKTVSFQLGGYAQANNMKYKTDDNVLPAGLADSVIKVDDATLPATADLFESQFAPTLSRPWIGGSIATINKVDQSDPANVDFSISTQPRILIHDIIRVNNLTFTDGPQSRVLNNDVVCVPYFDKQGGDYSLKFENLRLQYYPELEKVLKNCKKVMRYFLLTPLDIMQLDLLVPVYLQQDSAYYYINKIDNWQKGQPTKVELVKLG